MDSGALLILSTELNLDVCGGKEGREIHLKRREGGRLSLKYFGVFVGWLALDFCFVVFLKN